MSPVCIVAKVIQYLKQCRGYDTVVLSCWQSTGYWPMISDGAGFINEAIAHVELPGRKKCYVTGKTGILFGKDDLPFKMFAIRFYFSSYC